MGQQDQFRPPSLSGCCRLAEGTFAGISGKEEDAPTPAVRMTTIHGLKSTQSSRRLFGRCYGVVEDFGLGR